jgi:hypothetical protein
LLSALACLYEGWQQRQAPELLVLEPSFSIQQSSSVVVACLQTGSLIPKSGATFKTTFFPPLTSGQLWRVVGLLRFLHHRFLDTARRSVLLKAEEG